jgi:hypothetical protein
MGKLGHHLLKSKGGVRNVLLQAVNLWMSLYCSIVDALTENYYRRTLEIHAKNAVTEPPSSSS